MTNYGASHLVMLALLFVGIAIIIPLGRSQRGTPSAERFSRGFAVAIPAVAIPLQVLQFLPGEWDLDTSLPMHVCDFAWVAAAIGLWTHRAWAVGLTYFWGFTLSTQGVFTPDLGSDFPEARFLMYWAMHLLIVWSACYLAWGLRLVPTWREYRLAVAVTAVWAVCAIVFNAVADTNYGYLNGKPDGGSALDLLGPWPLYVVVEIALLLAVWAAMTYPWVRTARRVR